MNHTPRIIDTLHGPLVFGGRCLVMGILNVTPDSFSDGGDFLAAAAAVEHGRKMVEEGADVIDVGGESTRPGSVGVADDEQVRRVVPVIRGLRSAGVTVPISIDTQSAQVASAALEAGADIVNDVSGVRYDPRMPELLQQSGVPFVMMHMQGTPRTMQENPRYEDVVADVSAFFDERAASLERAGVDTARMVVDPGIGFGKTAEHNLTLLRNLHRFNGRWPLLVGPSRKRFLREFGFDFVPGGLEAGTAIVALHCALSGADVVRVHVVGPVARLVRSIAVRGETRHGASRASMKN